MKITAIRITNFRSFKGTQTFLFPSEPGLYFMQGRNEVEPRLGQNGAGKSTLWYAICWCLFAVTPDGLKAGDVCNWEATKGTIVEMDYVSDGSDDVLWTVRRTWGPNSWTLSHVAEHITDEEVIDLTKDTSNPVLNDLRLEFTPFLNCTLTAQGQPMFLDQPHTKQAELFSDVMGLDRWMGYSALASKKASAQDSISRQLEHKLASIKGEMEATKRNDLLFSSDQWERDRRAKLDKLETRYHDALHDLGPMKAKQPGLDEKADEAAKAWAILSPKLAELESELARHQVEGHDSLMMTKLTTQDMDRAVKHLKYLTEHDACPTCQQQLPYGRRQKSLREAQSTVNEYKQQNLTYGDAHLKAIEQVKVGQRSLNDYEQKIEAAKEQRDLTAWAVANARREIQTAERELDRMEVEAEEIEAEVNPFAKMMATEKARSLELQAELRAVTRRLNDSAERYSLLSFWVRGFKEVRLQLIAEALTELEIEVNSCISALGLDGWSLNFQVDRETKGGNIQRGFSVMVRSPHNTKPVPWAAWSGGEAQRLRLAGNMGLADLIRSRSGVTLNLEVWDEPGRGLNPQGVQDLLETLAARARTEGRVIWYTDHQSHSFGGFKGGATMVKAVSGSYIEQ